MKGEGRVGAGGKERGGEPAGGFESRLASVPNSYLRALGSLPRHWGWESPPNPLPKAEPSARSEGQLSPQSPVEETEAHVEVATN